MSDEKDFDLECVKKLDVDDIRIHLRISTSPVMCHDSAWRTYFLDFVDKEGKRLFSSRSQDVSSADKIDSIKECVHLAVLKINYFLDRAKEVNK